MISELERTGYRGALSLSCHDAVTGASIPDGILATGWRKADPSVRLLASKSKVSALLGFGPLPGLREYQWARATNGAPLAWPADPPPDPYVVSLVDTRRRYLPVVTEVPVPVAAPAEILLHSAASRTPASGWAVIRGEVHDQGGAPIPWPVITVEAAPDSYEVVADHLGRFLLIAPYPEALPPLTGSPPSGPGLEAMTWTLTLTVRSKPSDLVPAPGTDWDLVTGGVDPPELGGILGQPPVQQEVGGALADNSTATLAFGTPTVLTLIIRSA